MPDVSVIVPTRDRPQALARCLDALAAQCFPGEVEILVVDDGSKPPVHAEDVRLVRLPGKGSGAARNAGAGGARSELLCFTDDDCIPDPEWLATLHARLRNGAAVVAGRTVNGKPLSSLAAASQLVSNAVFDFAGERGAPASNLACRRTVALEVKFDEMYAGIAAEERDWYARVIAAGYDVTLEPRAVVHHMPAVSSSEFVRRHLRYGRGAYRFRRTHRAGRIERPSFYANVIRAGFQEGIGTGLAVCAAQIATSIGFVREMSLRHEKERPAPDVRRRTTD